MVQPSSTPGQPVFDDDLSWFAATAGLFGVKGQDAVKLIGLMDEAGTSYFSVLRDSFTRHIDEARRTGDSSKIRDAVIADLERSGAAGPGGRGSDTTAPMRLVRPGGSASDRGER